MNVRGLDDDQLRNLIDNHRKKSAFDRPVYAEAVEEFNRRHGGGLEFDRSLDFIREAAAEGRFLSYSELAEANGADWGTVRFAMNSHLWALVEHAHGRGWPMLSAIIVNKQNVDTGEMEDETLAGFVGTAKELGHTVGDAREFLREQQKQCFEWGRATAGQETPPL